MVNLQRQIENARKSLESVPEYLIPQVRSESMSNVVNGVVEAVSKDKKSMLIDGSWYRSWDALEGVGKGAVVNFDFVIKGTYKNVKGPVEIVTAGAPTGRASGPAPSKHANGDHGTMSQPAYYRKDLGYMEKQFPIPYDHPDRAIVRQNSLTNAVKFLTSLPAEDVKKVTVEGIIGLAVQFEKYSTGQLEMEQVTKAQAEAVKTVPSNEDSDV